MIISKNAGKKKKPRPLGLILSYFDLLGFYDTRNNTLEFLFPSIFKIDKLVAIIDSRERVI